MNDLEPALLEQDMLEQGVSERDAARWKSVLERDETADGSFVYGVCSTRVFCRASCPARRPHRHNARFFESNEDAIASGFRPCKRCRPGQESLHIERVQHACRLLETRDAPLSLATLAREIGISATHLQRDFKRATGISPREYADAWRLGQLKRRLREGPILDALLDAGYGSMRALPERAPSQLGMTPATYGKGGPGAQISFGMAPCSLGMVLVATTPKGVCAVSLGDSPQELEAALRREFFEADVQRDDGELQDSIRYVLQVLEGREPHGRLSLDVRATAWQWKVWRSLCEIKAGQTCSYAQVAQNLGNPNAVRAVARACATNPVALVVPCHRVVRGDGSPAGYRWGLERKKALLKREKEAIENA